VQAQSDLSGNSEAARRQERADFVDGPGDGGAVDAVEDGQSRVRKLESQDHQGGHHPIGENRLMARCRRSLNLDPFGVGDF